MTNPYPRLLSPLEVGTHRLRNRVLMGSMHTRLETLDRSVERRIAFYAARARGGAALLVTAGYSPNREGLLEPDAQWLDSPGQLDEHRPVTAAVHAHGAKFLLQILHAGRYAKHDQLVAPSACASHSNARVPRELTDEDIERTIEDFVCTAELACEAGYDGVEIMGSEGYLLTQFTAPRTNHRTDRWGGSLANRCRLPVEIVRRIRERLGPEFLLGYRISALDLVEDGSSGSETDCLARAIEAAGADMLVTGIGWHESPVPTIAYQVPRATWAFTSARLKSVVKIPVSATNRINTPEVAERLLEGGDTDLVALARPMLADPDFVAKAAAGRAEEINTCIACNQACLDYIFSDRAATCLVNPLAGREIEFDAAPIGPSKRIGIVGAGPAGLACAITAAARGHRVVLYEAADEIGGQLNLARRIPGKMEFLELLRYFRVQLGRTGVELRSGRRIAASELASAGFDHLVLATGATARSLELEGADGANVVGYRDAILGTKPIGARVAIIGTGGIGHDVAELLLEDTAAPSPAEFLRRWGVDRAIASAGGLTRVDRPRPRRQLAMFQRGRTRPGARLGVSTGWILRSRLKAFGVPVLTGCRYLRIDERGLHYCVDLESRVAEVDTIVVCAGQEPERSLADELSRAGVPSEVIGGARVASELDATRAILEGTRLAYAF